MTEVRKYGHQLSLLLQDHRGVIEEDCLDQALLVAVSVNNSSAVGKLIVKGVDNILDALNLSMVQERHQIRGLLLLAIAALDGSCELVLKLFGEEIRVPEELEVSCTFLATYHHLLQVCSQFHVLIAKAKGVSKYFDKS